MIGTMNTNDLYPLDYLNKLYQESKNNSEARFTKTSLMLLEN